VSAKEPVGSHNIRSERAAKLTKERLDVKAKRDTICGMMWSCLI